MVLTTALHFHWLSSILRSDWSEELKRPRGLAFPAQSEAPLGTVRIGTTPIRNKNSATAKNIAPNVRTFARRWHPCTLQYVYMHDRISYLGEFSTCWPMHSCENKKVDTRAQSSKMPSLRLMAPYIMTKMMLSLQAKFLAMSFYQDN